MDRKTIIAVLVLAAVAALGYLFLRPAGTPMPAANAPEAAAPASGGGSGAPGTLGLPPAPAPAPGTTAAAPALKPGRRMINGIEHVETRTLAGQVVWVPTGPEPDTEETAAPAEPQEFLPGPE